MSGWASAGDPCAAAGGRAGAPDARAAAIAAAAIPSRARLRVSMEPLLSLILRCLYDPDWTGFWAIALEKLSDVEGHRLPLVLVLLLQREAEVERHGDVAELRDDEADAETDRLAPAPVA